MRKIPVLVCAGAVFAALAAAPNHGVDIFDASTGTPLKSIPVRATSYTGLAFRPASDELWTGETSRNGPDALLITPVSESGEPGKSQRIALEKH